MLLPQSIMPPWVMLASKFVGRQLNTVSKLIDFLFFRYFGLKSLPPNEMGVPADNL